MKAENQDSIEKTKQRIGDALVKNFSASGSDFDQKVRSARKKLPRRVRRTATTIAQIEKAAKYQPYLLESQKQTLAKAERQVGDLAKKEDTKAGRSAARKQWLIGLILNYLVFLVLLVGFWYVATQI